MVHGLTGEIQQWSSVKHFVEERGFACKSAIIHSGELEQASHEQPCKPNAKTVVEAFELVGAPGA